MRITNAHLEAQVNRLNTMTGQDVARYHKNNLGKLVGNVGNYSISRAYGGVSLHQMANEFGGIYDVFRCGYESKRELNSRIEAFMLGIELEVLDNAS